MAFPFQPSSHDILLREQAFPLSLSTSLPKDNVEQLSLKRKGTGPLKIEKPMLKPSDTILRATPHKLAPQRSLTAFLHKLFNMVSDPITDNLIRWSVDGSSFIIEDQEEFAKTVLPRFYKHNTFASFVRQLNMYDFHKIPYMKQGSFINNGVSNSVWGFNNPYFQRGRADLLILMTRKRNRDRDETNGQRANPGNLTKEMISIKKQQSNITIGLGDLHKDTRIIWQNTLKTKEQYEKHEKIIKKTLQFLTIAFSNDRSTIYEPQSTKKKKNDCLLDAEMRREKHIRQLEISPDASLYRPYTAQATSTFLCNQDDKVSSGGIVHSNESTVLTDHQNVDWLEQNTKTMSVQFGINPKNSTDFQQENIPFISFTHKNDMVDQETCFQQEMDSCDWLSRNFSKAGASQYLYPPHSFSTTQTVPAAAVNTMLCSFNNPRTPAIMPDQKDPSTLLYLDTPVSCSRQNTPMQQSAFKH